MTHFVPQRSTGAQITTLFVAILALFAFSGCGDDSTSGPDVTYDFSATLDDYVEHVVVATYADLRDKSAAMKSAIDAFIADPVSQAKLDAAADLWVQTRKPWESSEAFLFGPAAFLSLDPALDSWPVDRQQLDDVLASNLDLNESAVDLLGPSVKGFHTIEYLLFRDGQPREVSTVTVREREYLAAVAAILANDCESLWSAWADGYDGGPAYGEEMRKAGLPGSRYVSQVDAVLEIVEGMVAICDEVANGKIADPFNEQSVSLVESQFSFNSLSDFKDNMRSVRNSYTGEYDSAVDGTGIDQFITARDANVHDALLGQMNESIAAIDAIPEPFRDNLNRATEINVAIAVINDLLQMLEEDLKPLISAQ